MPYVRVFRTRTGLGLPYFYPGDRSGTVHRFPMYRLRVTLAFVPPDYLGGPPLDQPGVITGIAILDTGAPLSIFPHSIWNRFADRIRWLDQPPAVARRQVAVLGGSFSYRLGRVRVGVVDLERRWLPSATVTGFFLDDVPAAPREAVLGLRCQLLDGRQLRHEPGPTEEALGRWWLEDPAPPVSR